ncbi:MAG: hypothetical protein ACRDGM_11665 [bacterium]
MVPLSSLWIPIVLGAVLVFVVSSIIHMVLPYHRSDYGKVPTEDDVMEALRRFKIPPGDYMVPRPGAAATMRSPEFQERMKKGPVLMMTVMESGMAGMGKQLAMWFAYSILVGVFAAYIAGRALAPGAAYLDVFRFAGTTAFAAYSLGLWQNSIWYKRSWSTTLKSTFDGLVYGMLTAGALGWLWPR